MPNRTKRKETVQENFINLIQDFGQKKEKKEPRKENPPKGERIDFTCLPSSGSLATHPFFSLSLSLPPSSRLHQKKKAEKINPPPLRSWLKSNQKDTIKKNHKSLRLGVYTSSGSTLRPTDRAAFPPSLSFSLLASPVTVMSLYIQLVGT